MNENKSCESNSADEYDWLILTPEHHASVKGTCIHFAEGLAKIHNNNGEPVAVIFENGVVIVKQGEKAKC